MRYWLLRLSILLAPVAVLAQVADHRTITTTGEATVLVAPDQAFVTIGVETFDSSLDVASRNNEQIATRLLTAWKALGVPESKIRTNLVTVSLEYEDASHPSRGIEGYFVRRSYEVTVDGAQSASKIIARSLASGANQVSGVEFRTTSLRKHRDEARVKAIRAAREKAELLAGELGASVGAPRTISESSGDAWRYNRSMSQNVVSEAATGDDGETGVLAPGQVAVRASVHVVFDLVPSRPR